MVIYEALSKKVLSLRCKIPRYCFFMIVFDRTEFSENLCDVRWLYQKVTRGVSVVFVLYAPAHRSELYVLQDL